MFSLGMDNPSYSVLTKRSNDAGIDLLPSEEFTGMPFVLPVPILSSVAACGGVKIIFSAVVWVSQIKLLFLYTTATIVAMP